MFESRENNAVIHSKLPEMFGKILICKKGENVFQLSFYVPHDHLEIVKDKIFQAGGGKIGNYDSCCFEYEGAGQFRPLEGSQPFAGTKYLIEKVREVKVELVVEDHLIISVIEALKAAHPYETPAYFVLKGHDI